MVEVQAKALPGRIDTEGDSCGDPALMPDDEFKWIERVPIGSGNGTGVNGNEPHVAPLLKKC
eukprot:2421702-Amphidinium_carterae.1